MSKFREYPEIPFGDEVFYKKAWDFIDNIFSNLLDEEELSNFLTLGKDIKESFIELDSYFLKITKQKCRFCIDHCCVNRHGFPDFEDLIVRRSMKLSLLEYDFSVIDTKDCQFLGKTGCILKRFERSYRCSWYFCDEVFDYFEKNDQKAFLQFEDGLFKIGQKRQKLLRDFYILAF